jgi:hypothetical protein
MFSDRGVPDRRVVGACCHQTEEHKQKYRLAMDCKSVILRLTDTPGMMPLDSLTKEVGSLSSSPSLFSSR